MLAREVHRLATAYHWSLGEIWGCPARTAGCSWAWPKPSDIPTPEQAGELSVARCSSRGGSSRGTSDARLHRVRVAASRSRPEAQHTGVRGGPAATLEAGSSGAAPMEGVETAPSIRPWSERARVEQEVIVSESSSRRRPSPRLRRARHNPQGPRHRSSPSAARPSNRATAFRPPKKPGGPSAPVDRSTWTSTPIRSSEPSLKRTHGFVRLRRSGYSTPGSSRPRRTCRSGFANLPDSQRARDEPKPGASESDHRRDQRRGRRRRRSRASARSRPPCDVSPRLEAVRAVRRSERGRASDGGSGSPCRSRTCRESPTRSRSSSR